MEKTMRWKGSHIRGVKPHGNRRPRYCPKCGNAMVKAGFNNQERQAWKCPNGHRTVNPIINK